MFQLLTKKLVAPVPAKTTSTDKKGINVNELKKKAKEAGELEDSRKSMTFNKTQKKNQDLEEDLDPESKTEPKLDVRVLQERYEKFKKDQEALSTVVNIKTIRQRYGDFRKKLEVWKERVNFRKRFKRTYLRNKASIREKFDKALHEFSMESKLIQDQLDLYTSFCEVMEARVKEENMINNWLQDMPTGPASDIIDLGQLERHIQTKTRNFATDQ